MRSDPRSFPGRTNSLAGGFTLLELLLVMMILGIILGIGLGTFATFDPGRRAARGLVAGALRQARNEAIANRAPARVTIDPEARTLRSQSYVVAGTWRFETASLEGAHGEVGGFPEGFAAQALSDGFIGKALDMDLGGRGSRVVFDLSEDPIFQVASGLRLSCALRPATLGDADILDYGGVVKMTLQRDGSVSFSLLTRRVDELGRPSPGQRVTVRTTAGALEANRWSELELRYDGRWITALVNGVPVAERAETRELWDVAKPLVIGGGRTRYAGRIDDLVVSVMRVGDEVTLPKSAEFGARKTFDVRFDSGGRLDPVEHARPVTIALLFSDGLREEVLVRTYGTVE